MLIEIIYEELYRWAGIIATPLILWLIANNVTLELAKQQHKAADEQNRQKILNDYLNWITILLVDKQLSLKPFRSPEARVARALSVSVLRDLDLERRKHLIDFLYEAELIQYRGSGSSPALLKGANLSELDLSGVYLEKADLRGTNLKNAKLINAKLFKADLSNANLDGADLSEAKLSEAIFDKTYLNQTKLYKAYLMGGTLIQSSFMNLKDTNLSTVNFTQAKYDDATYFPGGFNFAESKMVKI